MESKSADLSETVEQQQYLRPHTNGNLKNRYHNNHGHTRKQVTRSTRNKIDKNLFNCEESDSSDTDTTEDLLNVECDKMKNVNIQKYIVGNACGRNLIEIALRIILFIIFIKLERTPAFERIIQPEEIWTYKYPPTNDYVPAIYLLPATFIIPFIVILINYLITNERYDFSQATNVITLSLPLNGVVTSLLKISVGRPRPDFYYRCFPDGYGANTAMLCTGDPKYINEGRKSFPSGHSSFAFAGFGFIFLYLAAKLHIFNDRGRGQTWRLCISILPLFVALVVAISRTCDYHHHWQDVTVGSILGMSITYLSYRQYYPSIFSNHPQKPLKMRSVLIENASISSENHSYVPVVSDTSNYSETNPLIDNDDNDQEKDTKWI